jgi:hypothetical protein
MDLETFETGVISKVILLVRSRRFLRPGAHD